MLYLVKVSDKIGLSIYIVIPIFVYGSELWFLGDKYVRLNEDFQNVIGKRVQCLFPKTPTICAWSLVGKIRTFY